MRTYFPASALAVVLLVAAALPSQAVSFTYQTISNPSYSSTRVFGINDHGALSGDYGGGAFSYANGVFTAYSNGPFYFDTRINNAGDLVGSDGAHAGSLINGVASSFSVPGSSGSTYGSGINNNGVIIGSFDDGPGASGFKLENGLFSTIHVPTSTYTVLAGINDAGDMTGYYGAAGLSNGFLLHQGAYTTFNVPNATETYLGGINNAGNLTGNVTGSPLCPPTQNQCGFFYDGNTFTALAVPGARNTTAISINNLNQIAGFYVNSDNNFVGFVATQEGSGTPEPGTFFLMAGCMFAPLAMRRVSRRSRIVT